MKQLVHRNKIKLVKKSGMKWQQRMLVKLLVGGMKLEDASERINVSIGRCKRWLKKPEIIQELESKVEELSKEDSIRRKKRMGFIADELHEAFLEKVANGNVKKLGVKNLLKFILEVEKESKPKTPSVSRVDVHATFDIEEMAKRYKQSNSAMYDKKEEKVIDIQLPKKLESPKGEENGNISEKTEKQE